MAQRSLSLVQTWFNQHFRGWLATLVLMAISLLTYALEARDAVRHHYPITGFFVLPALVGMLLLPPRKQSLVVGLNAALTVHALLFLYPGAPPISGFEQRFIARLLALAICWWGSVLRFRFERTTALLQAIQNVSPVGMALAHRPSGKLISANPALGDLLGCSAEALNGREWSAFDGAIPDDLAPVQTTLRRCDGERRHAEVVQRPIGTFREMEGLVVLCALDRQRDVEAEQALRAKGEELRRKLATSLEAAALAHEIRQPLTALMLQCRRLQHQLELGDSTSGSLTANLAELAASTTELDSTISAMASLLRSVSTEHHPLDLASVVRSALQAQKVRIANVNVTLDAGNLHQPLMVLGDQAQLRIACGNLLRNALDALQSSPGPERRLAVNLDARDGTVTLKVEDSGPGFSDADLQGRTLQSSKPRGMGLGLFITESIATHHGGELVLGRSPLLGGAEVRLRIPDPSAPQPRRNDAGSPPAPVRRRSSQASG